MKRNAIVAGTVLSLACALALTSCKKDEIKAGETPTVKLEVVEEGVSTVSFRITATNAAEVAYIDQDDLTSVPSARAILTAGKRASVSEPQVIEKTDCVPGETYYYVAAAVSESGVYSEVATIELTAAGTNSTFNIEINASTDDAITYTVSPSDDNVSYITSILPAETYSESTDDEIFEAILNAVKKTAEEKGQSLADYIASISHTGEYGGRALDLKPETGYIIVAVGMENDGSQSSLIAKKTVSTTAPKVQLTFEMSVTEITEYSAKFTLKPSSENENYLFFLLPASKYPEVNVPDPEQAGVAEEVDTELANMVADAYIESEGYLYDQGIGKPYTGSWINEPRTDLASDTKYYLFAFAYEPRLGRQSDCEMLVFITKHGVTPEEFKADIEFKTITSTTVVVDVTPESEDMYGVYWGAFAFPKADYTVEAAQDAVTEMLEEHVELQHEQGLTDYTIQDAVQSVLNNGKQEFLLVEGLTPATEYNFVLVPVYFDGTFASNDNVVIETFTTMSDSAGGPAATVELIGYYDADEVYEANIIDMSQPSQAGAYYIAAFKVSLAEKAELCRYLVAEGSNYESEDAQICEYDTYTEMTDDQFLTTYGAPSWTEIPAGNYETETTAYIFVLKPYYDADTFTNPWIFGAKHTLIVMAQNESGVWGTSGRKFFYISSYREGYSWNNIFNVEEKGQVLSPVSDLVDLVNNLNEGVL